MLPLEVKCPKCKTELSLEENERTLNRFRCPSCMSFVDYSKKIPKIVEPEDYVKFLNTINQGEISLIKSIFDSEEIDYYISGDNFLSMDPLIQGAKVFVIKSDLEKATELLRASNPGLIRNNQKTK